jgi:hemerythrin-like metal-binding protein
MPVIEWNDSFSVGIESIDVQHKKIFDLINRAHDAAGSPHSREILNSIFNELFSYVLVHFSYEEDLMEKHEYEDLYIHRESHENLKKKVQEYQKRLDEGDPVSTHETLGFLLDWLRSHIQKTDMAYSETLIERGAR